MDESGDEGSAAANGRSLRKRGGAGSQLEGADNNISGAAGDSKYPLNKRDRKARGKLAHDDNEISEETKGAGDLDIDMNEGGMRRSQRARK